MIKTNKNWKTTLTKLTTPVRVEQFCYSQLYAFLILVVILRNIIWYLYSNSIIVVHVLGTAHEEYHSHKQYLHTSFIAQHKSNGCNTNKNNNNNVIKEDNDYHPAVSFYLQWYLEKTTWLKRTHREKYQDII